MEFFRKDSDAREWVFMILAGLFFFSLQWLLPLIGGYADLAKLMLIFAILVLGFDLFVGLTGYLSFGHAVFWGGGAYVAGLTLSRVTDNAIFAILIAVIIVTIVAFLMGLITLRRQGIYFSILTLAFGEMFYFLAIAPLTKWTNGDNGFTEAESAHINIFGWPLEHNNLYYFLVVMAILCLFAARQIRRSPYGLMLRAIKSNETRLTYTGIDIFKYKVMAFTISGLFGAIAGALLVIHEKYVPVESLRWTTSGEVVIMAVIGGMGTLFGPMLGAGIVLYLENVLSGETARWMLILGAIFMSFVIFLPGGVMDLPRRLMKLGKGNKQNGRDK